MISGVSSRFGSGDFAVWIDRCDLAHASTTRGTDVLPGFVRRYGNEPATQLVGLANAGQPLPDFGPRELGRVARGLEVSRDRVADPDEVRMVSLDQLREGLTVAGAQAYGQILLGLSKPCADVSRGATAEEILGVAAIVGLQAIQYRKLYTAQDWESAGVAR